MLKNLSALCLVVISLLSNSLAYAQIDNATAESLMRKSGMWQALSNLAPQMRESLATSLAGPNSKLSSTEIERISRHAATVYAPELLQSEALKVMAKKINAVDVSKLIDWFDSPVGLALTKLEVDSMDPSVDTAVLISKGTALFPKLSPSRRALIDQIAAETHCAEGITNITINSTLATLMGISNAQPAGPQLSLKEFRTGLESMRPELIKNFSRMCLTINAAIYDLASDTDLTMYVDFLKTAPGKRLSDTQMDAFDTSLAEAAAKLGKSIPASRDGSNT